MSEIKKGDLVICLWASENEAAQKYVGHIAIAVDVYPCPDALCFYLDPPTRYLGRDIVWAAQHLKKIDPPSTGEYDRVPVRKTEPVEVL